MESVKRIAEILGLEVDEDSWNADMERVHAVAARVTSKVGDPTFEADVLAAEAAHDQRGTLAVLGAFMQVNAPEPERVYKIKRSQKGQRIKIKSASGKNFAFGPVWVEAVRACKSLALNENNREKLNMHGTHVGVEHPEQMSSRELCVAIASRLPE